MTASLFLFIVLISLLNLGLGYALAVYQGHGPAFDLWGLVMPRLRPVRATAAPPHARTATAAAPTCTVASAPELASAADESPSEKPADAPDGPADAAAFHDAVEKSRDDAQRHREQLAKLNQQVREVQATSNISELDQCTSEWKDLNERYLDRQETNLQQASEHLPAGDMYDAVDAAVQEACQAHAADIQDSLDTVDGSKVTEDNLEDYCRQLLEETDRQIESSGDYRDRLDDALGRMDDDPDPSDAPPRDPERPAVVSTVETAVAKILTRWREDAALRDQSLTAALIDVDDYAQIVNRHGSLAGDRVVSAVRDLVATAQNEGGTLSHNSGQLFLLAYPGTSGQWVGASLERVRQTVEKTRFQHDGAVVPVTISTAAVEAAADDTAQTLCERLLATVRGAQDGGNNRTFLHEGTRPTHMPPPKLDIAERNVDL